MSRHGAWAAYDAAMSKKVGLSLSFCVKDIVNGRVKLEEVSHIVTACKFANSEDLQVIIDIYKGVYWEGKEDEGERVAKYLFEKGKLLSPRACGMPYPDIVNGHWCKCARIVDGAHYEIEY